MKSLAAAILILGFSAFGGTAVLAASHDAGARAAANFEFAETSPNRVWRLDRRTGEISVCSVSGDNLICTTSAEAATPPAKSYADHQAERRRQLSEAENRRAERRDRDVAFMEKIFDLFKALMIAAMERESHAPE